MDIEILHVPDCPNVAVLEHRLAAILGDRHGVRVRSTVVDTAGRAVETGMTGSPTLLVDGDDPFGDDALGPSLSCRLYRHDDGPDGAPSEAELASALADLS